MDDMKRRLAGLRRQQSSPSLEQDGKEQFDCRYCSKPTDKGLEICGHCQHRLAEQNLRHDKQNIQDVSPSEKYGMAIVGGLIVIIGTIGMVFFRDAPDIKYRPPEPPPEGLASTNPGVDETKIVTMCDLTVKAALISEADLNFGWKFIPRTDNEYRVVRGFKAQNGFGATLKHTYYCTYDSLLDRITKLEIEGPGGSQKVIG
jgi:hypothetical protein